MLKKISLCLLAAVLCAAPAMAAQVESGDVYCFSTDDLSPMPLTGICITELPDPSVGTVLLDTRVVQPGDILPADRLEQLTFRPVLTEEDAVATVGYLPIYADRVEQAVELTISVRGRMNEAPQVWDQTMETYRNIPNEGSLKASDPEGGSLVYTVTRQPRRGDVTVNEDGTFLYTPRKNKVGVDSFTFTAADPEGKVSREATVTVHILKPSQEAGYQDTAELNCRFEAEWLRNTGLFCAEQVGGQAVFQPEKEVTRGQFLVMLLDAMEVPLEKAEQEAGWLQPYLDAARRSGLLPEGESFDADAPVTGDEAAVWLQTLLQLPCSALNEELPAAELARMTLAEHSLPLPEGALTRSAAAELFHRLSLRNPAN